MNAVMKINSSVYLGAFCLFSYIANVVLESAKTATFNDCNGEVMVPGTTIMSQNYPNASPSSSKCTVSVQFEETENIQYTFLDFDIPGKNNRFDFCSKRGDHLVTRNGILGASTWCNFHKPDIGKIHLTPSNTMSIYFKSKLADSVKKGRGYMLKVDVIPQPPQCYCEFKNGRSARNGILCGRSGNFTKVANCMPDQWCTGPYNESNALEWVRRHKLCKTAVELCNEELLTPSCTLCPRGHEELGENWCSNHCYLEANTGKCKKRFKKIIGRTGDCTMYGVRYEALSLAKTACSSDSKCIGVIKDSRNKGGFHQCLRIAINHDECYSCNDIYKKEKMLALPQDFSRLENWTRCQIKDNTLLMDFKFPSLTFQDELSALHACEKYCISHNKCWGCTISRTGDYNWNAISECRHEDKMTGLISDDAFQKLSCFEIKLATGNGGKIGWSLGSCFGSQTYESNYHYIEGCCLPPGSYILTCQNYINPSGWPKGFIEFQGRRHCDSFLGSKTMTKVKIVTNVEAVDLLENGNITINSTKLYPGLIPTRLDLEDSECPNGTIGYPSGTFYEPTCYCEEYCRWDICRLQEPPQHCLDAVKSSWVWDSKNRFWVGQMQQNRCTFIPVPKSECLILDNGGRVNHCSFRMKHEEVCKARISLPDGTAVMDEFNCPGANNIYKCIERYSSIVIENMLGQDFGFKTHGTIVGTISKDSPAGNSSLEIGDQIFRIEDASVASDEDIVKMSLSSGPFLRLGVSKGHKQQTSTTNVPHIDQNSTPESPQTEAEEKINPMYPELNNPESNRNSIWFILSLGLCFCIYIFYRPKNVKEDPKILLRRLKITLQWVFFQHVT